MIPILDNGFKPIIIATKADKISRNQLQKHVKMVKEGLKVEKGTTVIPFSALSKQGRDEIYQVIEDIMKGDVAECEISE